MEHISHCDLFKRAMQSKSPLSPALQYLKDEHPLFRKQMETIHGLAQHIIDLPNYKDHMQDLRHLQDMVVEFEQALIPHSEKEEEILFPLMITYVGHGGGPIAVMEFEHEQAKGYLNLFLEQVENIGDIIDEALAKEMARNTIQMCRILTDHFLKEEEVLFPNAQEMLTDDEKKWLYNQFFKKQLI